MREQLVADEILTMEISTRMDFPHIYWDQEVVGFWP
jgi:hypothetical protein